MKKHLRLFIIIAIFSLSAPIAYADWITGQTGTYDKTVTKDVHDKVLNSVQKGNEKHAVLVFDLDHTLFDNRPRTYEILQNFASELPAKDAAERKKIKSLPINKVSYLIADTIKRAGVTDKELIKQAYKYWKKRFFSDNCRIDYVIPGASEYVNKLYKSGAFIVYLTGRSTENELMCTVDSLKSHGFPIGIQKTQLIMKPSHKIKDLSYKKNVLASIDKMGNVIACFENESKNLNAMADKWPQGIHVFLDTDANPKNKQELRKTIRTIPDYQ